MIDTSERPTYKVKDLLPTSDGAMEVSRFLRYIGVDSYPGLASGFQVSRRQNIEAKDMAMSWGSNIGLDVGGSIHKERGMHYQSCIASISRSLRSRYSSNDSPDGIDPFPERRPLENRNKM